MSNPMTFPDVTGILDKKNDFRKSLQMAHIIDNHIYVTDAIVLAKLSIEDLKMIYSFEIEEGVNDVSIDKETLKAMASSKNIALSIKKEGVEIIGKGGAKTTYKYSDPECEARKMYGNIDEIILKKEQCINPTNSVGVDAIKLAALVKPFSDGQIKLIFDNNKNIVIVKLKNTYNRSEFIIMKVMFKDEEPIADDTREEGEIPPTDEAMEKSSEQFTDDVVEEESCDGIGEGLEEQLNEIEQL